MKHICFIVTDSAHKIFQNKRGGGAERQVSLIARELEDRGYRVSYIVGELDGAEPIVIDNIEFWSGYNSNTGRMNAPRKMIDLLLAMKKVNADTYFTRGIPLNAVVASIYAKLSNGEFIYSSSNDRFVDPDHLDIYGWVFKKLYLSSLQDASTVIAQTKHQQALFQSCHNIDAKFIPNGYPPNPDTNIYSYGKRDYVLWVGRLEEQQKKPHRLLNIAGELDDIKFVIVCVPGTDEAYNEKIRTKAMAMENVNYQGFVPPEEIERFYKSAILLVNTSDYEGFPNTFLEAWRYGTPVLSLYHDVNDLLSENQCGRLSESMEKIVHDIKVLTNSKETWQELSNEARRKLRNEFSITHCVDLLEEEINS